MPAVVDEAIEVRTDADGEPISFVRARFMYTIVGQPQAFFRRLPPWWRGESSAERLDEELWRVSAILEQQHAPEVEHMYDICRVASGWRLAMEWE